MWRLVYIVGDTEFFRRPETKTVENLDNLDDSSDDSPRLHPPHLFIVAD